MQRAVAEGSRFRRGVRLGVLGVGVRARVRVRAVVEEADRRRRAPRGDGGDERRRVRRLRPRIDVHAASDRGVDRGDVAVRRRLEDVHVDRGRLFRRGGFFFFRRVGVVVLVVLGVRVRVGGIRVFRFHRRRRGGVLLRGGRLRLGRRRRGFRLLGFRGLVRGRGVDVRRRVLRRRGR
eukprot:3793-Pelagococcus_subviridis.AAC.1